MTRWNRLLLALGLLGALGYAYWKFAIPIHRVEVRNTGRSIFRLLVLEGASPRSASAAAPRFRTASGTFDSALRPETSIPLFVRNLRPAPSAP